MTMYRSQVIDSQLLALPTVSTASGSIATFDTDMTENLVSCVCDVTNASVVNITHSSDRLGDGYINGSSINASGQIISRSGSRMFYAPITQGTTYYIMTDEVERVYGFFTDVPVMGSTSYNGSRIVDAIDNSFVAPIDGYVAFRCVDNTNAGLYEYLTTYTVNLGSAYTGTVDVITGKIVDSNNDVYYAQNTVEIPTINGTNNIWCDTGDTSVKYILSVGKAIS